MKKTILKLGMMVALMLSASIGFAQQTTGDVGANEKVGKSSVLNGTVRVIDNKGTKKYLQVKNGLTLLTDTTPDGGIVSTWQLGGTLTDDTYIDATGKVFAIKGIKALDPATNTTSDIAATAYDATGFTLLVRDEATGETKKMLATDLVSGIRVEHNQTTDASADVAITVAGLPVLTAGTTFAKLFVYRNGAKLRSGTDFVATANTVTIKYDASELPMYSGDVIEIQYIK